MPDSTGFLSGSSTGNQYAAMEFFFRRMAAKQAIATLVKVVAVYSADGVAPAGVVDVQPLVSQIDGQGQITTRPIVYGVPYGRVQSGTDAIIMDPKVGDIGVCCFGDRDLSAVISSQSQAAPGSNRRNSLSDALYVCSILGSEAPTQYVQFSEAGIKVVSPVAIESNAPEIQINAQEIDIVSPSVNIQGNMMVNGNLGSTSGASGAFTTPTGQVITVSNGLITNIF